MSVPLPTVQIINLLNAKRVTKDNRGEPSGDFPPMTLVAGTTAAIPRALADAYNANRVADVFHIHLEGGGEYSYKASEFQARLSRFIGQSTLPQVTMSQFLEVFTQPL